jgi:predicted nucleic acid-binding protein
VIDTSVLIAGLIAEHEFHRVARPEVRKMDVVSGVVLAEAFAQLRRTFRLNVEVALAALQPWITDPARVAVLSPDGYVELFAQSTQLRLGGNIHDAVIAKTAGEIGQELVTLDRRQHAIAVALGVPATYLAD